MSVRNNIVHNFIDESISDLKLTFSRLLGFINDFHRKYLDEAIQEKIDSDLWSSGAKIKEYGEELYRRALMTMKEDGVTDSIVTCPNCGWDALCACSPKEDTCYVCNHIDDVAICERCHKAHIADDLEEYHDGLYCSDCLNYLTDDYWYEQSVGK